MCLIFNMMYMEDELLNFTFPKTVFIYGGDT